MKNKTLAAAIAAVCLYCSTLPGPALAAELKVSIGRTNQDIMLSWFGSNAVAYQVESSTDFNWTNLSPVLAGAGDVLSYTNPISGSERRFYRVKQIPEMAAVFDPLSGILTVIGNELDNHITVSRDGVGAILVNNGTEPVTGGVATVANTVLVEVFGRAGNDQLTMDQSGGLLPSERLWGEEGADTLTGSSAADQLYGGPGSDILTGRGGNDFLDGGSEDDAFLWNPGDGSDTLEGLGGNDTLVFNGSNANENLNLSANGGRLRLTRDVASIVMDMNGVEQVTLNTLGGADTVTISSLVGTAAAQVNVDLAAIGGGAGDAQADTVIVQGSASADTFDFAANAGVIEAGGLGALVRVLNGEAAFDTISVTGLGGDLVNINGTAGADTMTVVANSTVAQASTTGFSCPVSVSGALTLAVNGLGGPDTISCSGNLAAIAPLILDGGDGEDTISGGNGADTILGGAGNDILDGNQGNDVVFGGSDNDTFVWDPGDGSDTLEGQSGNDTLVFNGSNANENMNLSANGARLSLTRDVGAIVMDVNGVEQVTVKALGGADTLTVSSLVGTAVAQVNVDLAAAGGVTGDSQADTVFLQGSASVDTFSFAVNSGAIEASGRGALVRVLNGESALDTISVTGVGGDLVNINGTAGADTMIVVANGTVALASTTGFSCPVSVSGALTLAINGLGGPDTITCSGNLAAIVPLILDGGEGDDTISGSNGADTIFGGAGNDILDGNQGNDVVFGGEGNDTFVWDPGDGSDTLEGQSGNDTLVFNGSNTSEIMNLSANGARLLLTRNVGSIVMDVNGVEQVTVNALGGADTVTVNSLAGTVVAQVNVDLAAAIGGTTGDSQVDGITLNGTANADAFGLTAFGGVISVAGITPLIQIAHSEVAFDSLVVNGLGGTDTFSIGAGVTSLIAVTTNQ